MYAYRPVIRKRVEALRDARGIPERLFSPAREDRVSPSMATAPDSIPPAPTNHTANAFARTLYHQHEVDGVRIFLQRTFVVRGVVATRAMTRSGGWRDLEPTLPRP